MSSTRGVRWLRCVDATPPMSAATDEIRSRCVYQPRSTGVRRQRERRGRPRQQLLRRGLGQAALRGGPVGERQQLRTEQHPFGEDGLQPGRGVGVEVARVVDDEHRGEHPERVARQLGAVDRPERRRHHRHRARPGVAQVVEADRRHPERREDPPGLGQLARGADPDRPVPLGRDPPEVAEPLRRVAAARDDVRVHLAGDLDERLVRRHLPAVHRREPPGEGRAQLPRRAHRSEPAQHPVERRDARRQLALGDGQRRAEPQAAGAAAQHDHVLVGAQRRDDPVAQLRRGQRDRAHQPAAARVAHRRLPVGQVAQHREQARAEHRRARDQGVGLHDLQDAPRPHHVGQPAAPRRVDPRAHGEDVVGHLVHPPARHDPADLRLLAERDDVRREPELLVGPRRPGEAAPGLHLVDDEQRVVAVAELLQRLEERGPEVVVAALALDRLDDRAGDVVRVRRERGAGLREGGPLPVVLLGRGDAGAHVGVVDPRPVELREAGDLDRVGVGQRHRVAGPAVERLAQVQHPGAERGVDPVRPVPPRLPVERDLERVLDRERAALDEEQVGERRVAQHPGEGVDEAGHRDGVDVGVARFRQRRASAAPRGTRGRRPARDGSCRAPRRRRR